MTDKEKKIAEKLGRHPLFADRDTLDEALNYALQIAESSLDSQAVLTSVMVLHNTWAKLAAQGELDPKKLEKLI